MYCTTMQSLGAKYITSSNKKILSDKENQKHQSVDKTMSNRPEKLRFGQHLSGINLDKGWVKKVVSQRPKTSL